MIFHDHSGMRKRNVRLISFQAWKRNHGSARYLGKVCKHFHFQCFEKFQEKHYLNTWHHHLVR